MRHTRTVGFHTLGCKLNFSETSTLARSLEEAGYARVRVEERPDVFVLNTCSVTGNADKECRRHVRRFQAINPEGFIAVIGCYAQLKPQEIAAIPGVDLVLGANEKFDLAAHLERNSPLSLEEGQGVRVKEAPGVRRIFTSPIKETKQFIPSYSANDRTRTFLKVQDGCDYFCSFCTIPLARGRSRSGSIAGTLMEVKKIAGQGIREVVLTGVNTGDFGRAHNESFLQLIQALDKVEGIDRFRISSIEPNLCSDEIIGFVAASNKFAPHFHIPLQSGSDVILQRMRRRYDTALYRQRVQRIKELMPHACIGVDVITGTPGETEEEFMKTHEFLRSIPVDYLHVFTYSERANTTAVRSAILRKEDTIPMEVRRERTKQLRILGSKMQRAFYQRHSGTVRLVLFEQGEHAFAGSHAADQTSAGSRAADPAVQPAGHRANAGSFSEDPAEVMVSRAADLTHTSAGSRAADPAVQPALSGGTAEVMGMMEGYTDNYIRVTLAYDPQLADSIVPVTLGRINGDGHMEGSIKEWAFPTSNIPTSNLQPAV